MAKVEKIDFKNVEKKWQKFWEKHKTFHAHDFADEKPKYYPLVEFPYPSGAGLHVGHPRPYTALDIVARKRRMQGYNVMFAMGWDAFGLPTENYAIKTGRQPAEVTAENIATFKKQIQSLGISFDWSREINTTDPKYYKWTQWIFLKLFEAGLAYKANIPVNWCLSCKIGLANEEIVDGACERCGGEVEKRDKEQWMLGITKYADRLLEDLDGVDYIERAKVQQKNWIGRSEGSEIDFKIVGSDEVVRVFTTRADTLFGATYMVLAPEHELVDKLREKIGNWDEVKKYRANACKIKEMDRLAEGREKTGVVLKGVMCVNPANGEEIPVWIADYVLTGYGTGAIMAVPAHDERDLEFAEKFKLEVLEVVGEDGGLINSGEFDGINFEKAKSAITEKVGGEMTVKYKLRDWVFSRQRYWGEPIPLVNCEKCKGWVALPETELPLELPKVEKYEPTDTGESPLSAVKDWVNTKCPQCGGSAKRETDTMPNWAGSSWYFLRYCAPNDDEIFEHTKLWKRKAIKPNAHDKVVWETYLKIREIFAEDKLDFWVCGSLLMNVLNREIWKHMDDLDVHVRSCDYDRAIKVMTAKGFVESDRKREGSITMTHAGVNIELIEVFCESGEVYTVYSNGQKILMAENDLEMVERGSLNGVSVRTISPWHALYQYTYLQKHLEREKEGDDDKKQFLRDYLNSPMNYWMGVDWYNGGMEHTVLHLLYSRFWNKFLFDLGVVPVSEPYNKRTSHGLILAKGGEKMSKSKGNVINPDEIVGKYGADTFRVYEMFMGPFDQTAEWDTNGLIGVKRFLDKVWKLQEKVDDVDVVGGEIGAGQNKVDQKVLKKMHWAIHKVSADIEAMRFNTAVSALMELVNDLGKLKVVPLSVYRILIKLLSVLAPHMCEELWSLFGDKDVSVSKVEWPDFDKKMLEQDEVTYAVQVNGKLRASFVVGVGAKESEVREMALGLPNVVKWLDGKKPKKVIVVNGRMVSVVV